MSALVAAITTDDGTRSRLVCRGRLDVLASAALRRELDVIIAGDARRVTLDLSQADHVDAAASATVASGIRALRHRAAVVDLVPPVEIDAGRLLEYCGLGSLIPA